MSPLRFDYSIEGDAVSQLHVGAQNRGLIDGWGHARRQMAKPPEVWLRGPVDGIPPALQPVAHALLQVREDLPVLLQTLTHDQLWARPGNSAPIGFHVVHLAGSL